MCVCVCGHQYLTCLRLSIFYPLFVFVAASSLFSICPHSPFVIPFGPCPLIFLFHQSLSSSSSLTLVNAVWQEVHFLHAIETVQWLSAPSFHPVGCFAICLDEMQKKQLKACFSLAASFISQYVGHLYIRLSYKGFLIFVIDELHFFSFCVSKCFFFFYFSQLEKFFYFLILMVFDVLN